MANVGTAAAGKTLIGAGNTLSPTFASIGTNSGLTNHGLIVGQNLGAFVATGAGNTGQIMQSQGASADPTYTTATYPSTTTINQILYSSAANTVGGITGANNGVLITSNTGVPSLLANGTTGQILTATTGSPPSWGTITGAFPWTDQSGTFTAAINNGYFLTAAATPTLPAAPSQGDRVSFAADSSGSVVVTANTGQKIRIGNNISSTAGTATNSAQGDSLTLVYRTTGATWISISSEGNWTTA